MTFEKRHIGLSHIEITELNRITNTQNLDELIDQTIPKNIKFTNKFDICDSMTEFEYLTDIKKIATKNKLYKNFIGKGYYETITPSVILRNIFENPGWYTPYTPYQAEISQGRLESLLNFQTMICELTGFPLSNSSLLDESTAASEAMTMFFNSKNKSNKDFFKFWIDSNIFEQTKSVLYSKAEYLGITIVEGLENYPKDNDTDFFGALFQNPDSNGCFEDLTDKISFLKAKNIYSAVISDIMSLVILKNPAQMGADCSLGSSQRFGIPMGFGGPYAAFFACTEEFKRLIPGRIIGVSKDRLGNQALRMALQTREQHIKREKATSNICTAQALLANMAAMYAIYHGPIELKRITKKIIDLNNSLAIALDSLGLKVKKDKFFFDTTILELSKQDIDNIILLSDKYNMNFHFTEKNISITFNETNDTNDLINIILLFEEFTNKTTVNKSLKETIIPENLLRKTDILSHKIFNSFHTETKMMRYIKKLEDKDLSLTKTMIPLGSCTMKLNAATELIPLSWPEFSKIHPFAPKNQTLGYLEVIDFLEKALAKITGFDATSLQPNSGAQGEYSGLLAIRNYQKSIGEGHRNICIIPSSAHGTNPASAVLAGLEIIVTPSDENGNINFEELVKKVNEYKNNLSCFMVTYPSTHGIFEEQIMDICKLIHDNGGQVYMDGANMNAQVGYTSPGFLGADVCHLNLHKTFAIPHGGGGPGVGPICSKSHLKEFLPSHPILKLRDNEFQYSVSSAPYGSASVLLISYAYIKMLGSEGLRNSTKIAIANANYIKCKLENDFKVLYNGVNSRVAHEVIIDFRPIKQAIGIDVTDIAKRLMDYGIHAPTVSFPVAGTLMIEPTESEDLLEIDRFCDAMIHIKKEIDEVVAGKYTKENNVLKNAPHTAKEAILSDWEYPYSREKAIYPLASIVENKYWVPVSRIDDSFGDRNLICNCPSIDSYN